MAFCFFTLQEFLKKNCRKSTMIEIPVIIDSDSLKPLSVLLSKLSGSLFFQLFQTFSKKRKKIIKAILCNFSMRMLKHFWKKKKILPTKSWKSHPQKLLRIPQIHFFSLLPWLPKQPNQKNSYSKMWPNWLTVYRTGIEIEAESAWDNPFHY